MRNYPLSLIATIIVSQISSPVNADFFQSNLTPFDSAHLLGSDGYFEPGVGLQYGVETIDNFNNVSFTPNSGQTLVISWAGAYFDRIDGGPLPLPFNSGTPSTNTGNFLPDPNPSFGIRFYSPNELDTSLPDFIPFFETFLTPSVFTYPLASQTPGLEFHAFIAELTDAPALNPNQEYFISIFETDNNTDPGREFPTPSENAFYWTSAKDLLLGGDLQRDMSLGFAGEWHSTGTDSLGRGVAIETAAASVPEPCSLLLLGTISGFWGIRRTRRKLASDRLINDGANL